ncbi:reverse transcriptase [Phytophthora megakarya]|uniref:Reverse transcriptase n=1 Tax=Phytophthora megakarya TaxID=4795 RepID=A0A225WGN5_9STRA|nr:reverse transcriptase [Phytophthora megakarya]
MNHNDPIERDHGPQELRLAEPLDERWIMTHKAFTTLKTKIAATPILRHFDEARTPVVIVYASDWVISASLTQEHDRIYHPVAFASRTLKTNKLNYNVTENEVLALLTILDLYYNLLVGREIRVLTRHSTITGSPRAMVIPSWPRGLTRSRNARKARTRYGGDSASITPRAKTDDALIDIAPRKEHKRRIQTPIRTVYREEDLWVVGFDGLARVKRGGGAFSAIVWSLPGWEVVKARSGYLESLTVNEAEYNGLLLGLDMLENLDRKRLVICGVSNLVIRQVRGEIDCKAPWLTLLKRKALDRLRKWGVMNYCILASAAMQRQGGIEVQGGPEHEALGILNRGHHPSFSSKITRGSHARGPEPGDAGRSDPAGSGGGSLDRRHEEVSEIADLTQAQARSYGNIVADYEVDEQDLLFYYPPTPRSGDDHDRLLRLVVPEKLQSDVLHHYHTMLEGGYQGVGRTYQRIRDHLPWRGLYRRVQRYVGECVDCETGKGKPVIRGESPGNLQAKYPFQIIAMDHIPSLPKSHKRNTELLIWVDLCTGYVIVKARSSQSAQTVAESYEECVFRRFGASERIRHDREPGFMSDFFPAFNKILGQRQQATMAYWPQANGTAERMVQTVTRALKMYVRDLERKDWDEYAERLTFAINTAHDRIREDTPHYLVHGWDPRSTLEAKLPVGCTERRDRDARRWRYWVQRHYQQSRGQVNAKLREAIADLASRHNEDVGSHKIEAVSRVCLYLDRVKEGYAWKLAHLIKLEIAGTGYQIFPAVHVSKLKLVKDFPDRPRVELKGDESYRPDFDEILLPEDSWVPDLGADEYEVERISDVRSEKKTRFGRIYREFLVHWVGYNEPIWVEEAKLNCGAILNAFLRDRANRNRFNIYIERVTQERVTRPPSGTQGEQELNQTTDHRRIPFVSRCPGASISGTATTIFSRIPLHHTNGQRERSVKTVMQSVRVYAEDQLQQDWDEIGQKMIFAINHSLDSTSKSNTVLSRVWMGRAIDAQGDVLVTSKR